MLHSGSNLSKLWNASKNERWHFLKKWSSKLGEVFEKYVRVFPFFIDLIDFLRLLKNWFFS